MKLNKEELLIGFLVGIIFWFKVSWWALPLALLTSFLWAYTGWGASKLYRRLGVPLLCGGIVALVYHSLIPLISVPLAFGVLSIGYGIPTTQPPDEGSLLGQVCFELSNKNERLAEIYCRTTIYTLLAIAFIPCWITK